MEIAVPAGAAFPDCPNHPNLPTIWKSTVEGKIPKASELADAKKDVKARDSVA